MFVHLTLVPYIAAAGEVKTKPTQHSVRELMEIGIQPDFLICRTERPLGDDVKRKIALFCNVDFGAVIESPDVPTIYEIPLSFETQGFAERVMERLELDRADPGPRRLARDGAAHHASARPREDLRRGQVHRLHRQLQERAGGADPRRHRQRRRRRPRLDRRATASPSPETRARDPLGVSTACWCPAASACAASRAWSRPSARRARCSCRSSASASACRWRSSSSRAHVLRARRQPLQRVRTRVRATRSSRCSSRSAK